MSDGLQTMQLLNGLKGSAGFSGQVHLSHSVANKRSALEAKLIH